MGEANVHVRDRGRMRREFWGESLNLGDPLRADIYVCITLNTPLILCV